MMSLLQDYIDKMLAQKTNTPELDDLDSTSKVSIWRNIIYIVAFLANFIKELSTIHLSEVESLIDAQKITNLNYYRQVVFEYRDGHTFDSENLTYIGDYTDDQINSAKIVKRSAAQEITENGIKKIALKLATEDEYGSLKEIDELTLQRIEEHVRINAPAGTNLSVTSKRADELKLEVNVYIDPQILTLTGSRVDGTENDVIDTAVGEFFADKNFKFDGELVLSLLADKIQSVPGVQDRSVNFKLIQANHTVPSIWEEVIERYTAYSGYYKLIELKVNYLVK